MTSSNHTNNRALQQDAHAWKDFTGCSYTAALRQMESPLAQGFLGERISARQLIATLENHILIGSDGGDFVLGDEGFYADNPFKPNQGTDYIELALIADMLRMFTPLEEAATPEVSSYTLKHTVEKFLRPHFSYVTNGRLIWAAAALGLPIEEGDRDGAPNLLIGVPEHEHDYVRRMVDSGRNQPQGHHYQPPGFKYLQTALEKCAAGGPVEGRWVRPTPSNESTPFHDWLILQADRDEPIGDFASDYAAGIRISEHRIARTPDELMEILEEVPCSPEAHRSAEEAVAEWTRLNPPPLPRQETTEPQPAVGIRTQQINATSEDVGGFGAGAGNMKRYEFLCPCGEGKVIEEHDNIPGFRDHSHWIECGKCSGEWRFVSGRSVYDWALEPAPQTPEQDSAA